MKHVLRRTQVPYGMFTHGCRLVRRFCHALSRPWRSAPGIVSIRSRQSGPLRPELLGPSAIGTCFGNLRLRGCPRTKVLCVKFCKQRLSGGLAELGLLVLLEVVHVEVSVGFEPVLVCLDGEGSDEAGA